MKNILITSTCFLLLFSACKNETKKETTTETSTASEDFEMILKDYYEDGLKLNPVNATMTGDNRYNDQFNNLLSEEQIEKQKEYHEY